MNEYSHATGLLRKLYHISFALLANVLLSGILPGIAVWVGLGLRVYCVYLMFQLKPENEHYAKAAIFYTISLIGGLFSSGILALAGSICSLVAQYQEFHGHGELVAPWAPKLQSRWGSLFWFQFAATIILSLLTGLVTAVLVIATGMDETAMQTIITLSVAAISLVLQGVYLLFLKRTIQALEADVAVV